MLAHRRKLKREECVLVQKLSVQLARVILARLRGTAHQFVVHDKWVTVPNGITVLGLLGVALYCWLFVSKTFLWLIPLVNIGIILSDVLDGIAADVLDQHSFLGKVLDPVRDRVHAVAMFANIFLYSATPEVWAGIAAVCVAECFVAGIACVRWRRGQPLEVHGVGKGRATLHWLCILVMQCQLYWLGYPLVSPLILLGLMFAASVLAGLFYLREAAHPVRYAG